MSMDLDALHVLMVQLQAAVDRLDLKLDARLELVAEKASANERESRQIHEGYRTALEHTSHNVEDLAHRLTNVARESQAAVEGLDARLDDVDRWRARLVGVAVGAGLSGGSVAGLLIKALGG